MENEDLKNEIAKAAVQIQCYENFDKVELAKNSTAFPIADIAALGAGFSSVAPMFNTITQTIETASTGNLYRCVFPNGVTGRLAEFSDGSGKLGTIIGKNGIAGQARWIKADSIPTTVSTQMPFDPTAMFMAIALMNLNKKLDSISNTQKSLVESIEQERKSQLLADLQILAEIAGEYKYYWNNDNHLTACITQVKSIKRNARKELISYKDKIEKSLNKKDTDILGSNKSVKIEKIANNLIHYKLALYNQSFASYMQIMLTRNFDTELLQKTVEEIEKNAYQYKILYTDCYNFFDSTLNLSLEKHLAEGVSKITKKVGEKVASMPKLSKTMLDEVLIGSSEKIESLESKRIEKATNMFIQHKDSGIKDFADNIKTIDKLYNQPMELVFDNKNIYLLNEA